MFKKLKQKVLKANIALVEYGLVQFTWGNASQIEPNRKYFIIKPSGVRYEDMDWEHMCVLSMADGSVVEGDYKPSTDAQTHFEIYRRFESVGGIAHTHSTYATAFAQAGSGIPCFGTTHADYFYGEIPCTRELYDSEIENNYELNTGSVIVNAFFERSLDPLAVPGALVSGHGPFAWGQSAADAATNAAYLEQTARLAYLTKQINPEAVPAPQVLLVKHYNRKHGASAYYGQCV